MKTNVQNTDLFGAAAAAVSSQAGLQNFLASKKVDTSRYEAVGVGFSGGNNNLFSGFIVCKDNQKSTEDRDHILKVYFEEEISRDEFFSLFKQFDVVLASKQSGYEIAEVDGELVFSRNDE
ncbi:hypothetical protein ACFS7Z_16660 [Pontibacter toksunensis]|uniref:Uncharacterized protein n=1 Tax=Pontibacter toksunensis TaxID=1332631 RepID=A0ABW6BYE4_9BACT